MNVKVSEVIVDLLIMARELQHISAESDQEKKIFEMLFKIGETVYAGMSELKRDK